jgi:cell division protein ZapA (FtsZ GTPase activity inhibitor)
MAIVDILIRNNLHQLACNDSEEGELKALAVNLSKRIDKLAESHAKANDNLLLIMAALTIEDELIELKRKQQQLPFNMEKESKIAAKDESAIDFAVADALDAISEYVETLVIKLNK